MAQRTLGQFGQNIISNTVNVNQIDNGTVLKYLKVSSMYYEELKTKYSNAPEVQEIIQSMENNNSTNRDSYDIYIVVTLDIEKYKFYTQQQGPRTDLLPTNMANQLIVWKWGSEKRFFDYLNILCDELTGQDLQTYTSKTFGSLPPIDALKKLWEKYREKTFDEKNPMINMNQMRDTILEKTFAKSKTTVMNGSVGGTNQLQFIPAQVLVQAPGQAAPQPNPIIQHTEALRQALVAWFSDNSQINNPNKQSIIAEVVPKIMDMIQKIVLMMRPGVNDAFIVVQQQIQPQQLQQLQQRMPQINLLVVAVLVLFFVAFVTPSVYQPAQPGQPARRSVAGDPTNCTSQSIIEAGEILLKKFKNQDESLHDCLAYSIAYSYFIYKSQQVLGQNENFHEEIERILSPLCNPLNYYKQKAPLTQEEKNYIYHFLTTNALDNQGGLMAGVKYDLYVNFHNMLNNFLYRHNPDQTQPVTQGVLININQAPFSVVQAGQAGQAASPGLQGYNLRVIPTIRPNEIFGSLVSHLYNQIVNFDGCGDNVGRILTILNGPNDAGFNKILKRIMNVRACIQKGNFENNSVIIVTGTPPAAQAGAARAAGATNIITNKAGQKYVLALIDLIISQVDRNILGKSDIQPVDYMIGFVWNAYDPSIDISLKRSLKLMRLNPSDNFYADTKYAEKIMYFRELQQLFKRFMVTNKFYLAGIQQNGQPLAPGTLPSYVNMSSIPAERTRNKYKSMVEDAAEKTKEGREAIREYFLNRFGNGVYFRNVRYLPGGITSHPQYPAAAGGAARPLAQQGIQAVPGPEPLVPIFGEQAAVPDNRRNPFYQTQKQFMSDLSKLTKKERDIVIKLFKQGQETQTAQTKTITTSLFGKKLYIRFMDLCTLVYAFRHKNDADVKTVIQSSTESAQAANDRKLHLIFELKLNNPGIKSAMPQYNYTAVGGKKRSKTSKSKMSKSSSKRKSKSKSRK